MPSPISPRRQQLYKLVELMKENVELAQGTLHGQESKQKWNAIAENLNRQGPFERKGKEWRKVWEDLKFKQQLRHNQRAAPDILLDAGVDINLEDVVTHIFKLDAETQKIIEEAINMDLEFENASNEDVDVENIDEVHPDADMPYIDPRENELSNTKINTLRELRKYIEQRNIFHNNLLETMRSMAESMKNVETYQRKYYVLEKERVIINKRYLKRKEEFKRCKIELQAQILAYKNSRRRPRIRQA